MPRKERRSLRAHLQGMARPYDPPPKLTAAQLLAAFGPLENLPPEHRKIIEETAKKMLERGEIDQ